ncbi:hypothetical protein OAS19_01545 [Altererythrobacter sp.]|nr:hypothetical protein [Altererythrobacter sp.]
MSEPQKPEDTPTLHISWANLTVGFVLALGWYIGMGEIAGWAGTDLGCLDKPGYRGSHLELAVCAIADGPKGWAVLAWFAWPVIALGWWMRKKLGKAKK